MKTVSNKFLNTEKHPGWGVCLEANLMVCSLTQVLT